MASLPTLLAIAWLLPLVSFAIIVFFGPRLGKAGIYASHVATGAILTSGVLSILSLAIWIGTHGISAPEHGEHAATTHAAHDQHGAAHDDAHGDSHASEHASAPAAISGVWYEFAQFGKLRPGLGYYIDALTVVMFTMVTIIATCIHFYAYGYMHDELHDVHDHDVKTSDGHDLHRPGRFHRFFQYLSLFCFSMLGIVIAGNILMVFVFWELVGICSYFLIGFYFERKSASTAANKAFIYNRVGDFGMIIGLMALWSSLGVFNFGDVKNPDGTTQQGIFSLVRSPDHHHELRPADGMVIEAASKEITNGAVVNETNINNWREQGFGYGLLVIAGIGIFCGCIGKSAQFPLHVWLPDAMEGPTPVSALVHSATMVAAGVYLTGRFYPVFTPEVLLVIACVGGITLFIAATIAITAVDIKRVLAYSTISQLGYMMLALGLGGWLAGLFHLITHAFFKSLLFMCSGSVIHAVHTNDMMKMGGLRKKMPYTAYTMLIGCLAIIGAPLFSGFFSKDAIIAQAFLFWRGYGDYPGNVTYGMLFLVLAAGGAAITAFYMFRLWFLTFAGEPRDHHIYDHVHESPPVMYMPLVVLSCFAVGIGWPWLGLTSLLEQARPAGSLGAAAWLPNLVYGNEHLSHEPSIHWAATAIASATAAGGFALALVFYGKRLLNAEDTKRQFAGVHNFLINKWYFDELYSTLFIRPAMFFSGVVSRFDRKVIDRFIDSLAWGVTRIAHFDDLIDRYVVDKFVNVLADWTWSAGNSLRSVQTGKIRQYVMLIVVGLVALAALINIAIAN